MSLCLDCVRLSDKPMIGDRSMYDDEGRTYDSTRSTVSCVNRPSVFGGRHAARCYRRKYM
jgi:hypothetical protein